MPVVRQPFALAILVEDHNGINIVNGTELFACPLERFEQLADRMARIKSVSVPRSRKILWGDWRELVEDVRELRLFKKPFCLK